jgi:uncharacterized membrane protein
MTAAGDQSTTLCQVCKREKRPDEVMPAELVGEPLVELIRLRCPNWSSAGFICLPDLNRLRMEYVEDVIEKEKGELSSLDEQVLQSIAEQTLLTENINLQFDHRRTLWDRGAEKAAEFFGSWGFLLSFGIVLVLWLAINGAQMLGHWFDPYPFDLLKLGLATVAAIQAPTILMTQNRQKAKDRLRAEQEYRVSLKAEMEIRHLNAKMDVLLTRWWPRLRTIERMQLELHAEIFKEHVSRTGPTTLGNSCGTGK